MDKILRLRVAVPSSDNRKSKIENLKLMGLLTLAIAFALCGAVAQAQQARTFRIGILAPLSVSSFSARLEGLRKRLRELGYIEGKNIFIEIRYAEGKLERLPDL